MQPYVSNGLRAVGRRAVALATIGTLAAPVNGQVQEDVTVKQISQKVLDYGNEEGVAFRHYIPADLPSSRFRLPIDLLIYDIGDRENSIDKFDDLIVRPIVPGFSSGIEFVYDATDGKFMGICNYPNGFGDRDNVTCQNTSELSAEQNEKANRLMSDLKQSMRRLLPPQ